MFTRTTLFATESDLNWIENYQLVIYKLVFEKYF